MSELSINVYEPLAVSTNLVGTVTRPIGYTHTIQALGGYWSASFSVSGGTFAMDDWLQGGIGRHLICYNRIRQVWEGFVNEVEIRHGGLTIRHGPLLDIGNRVKVSFSGVDITTTPPTVGTQVETDDADDTDSQVLYGIIPKVVAGNEINADDAEQIRDSALIEMAYPKTSKDWTSGSSAETATVMIKCLGYVHMLLYPYNQTTFSGEQNASDKITNILNSDPNSLFDTTYVTANTVQVPRYEYENTLAWPLIQDVVARGGTSNERWLFGIYNSREAHYEAAPTAIRYWHQLSDPAQRFRSMTEGDVPYPEIEAGEWLLFSDFLVGRGLLEDDPRTDPRAMFIEQVTFTAPNTLALKGGLTDKVPQMLAKGVW